MAQTYRDVIAWQKAMDLVDTRVRNHRRLSARGVVRIDRSVAARSGLNPSNIAEGQARYSHAEFYHFLQNTRGSLAELETQLQIACNLKYIKEGEALALLQATAEEGRILNALLDSVKKRGAGSE